MYSTEFPIVQGISDHPFLGEKSPVDASNFFLLNLSLGVFDYVSAVV